MDISSIHPIILCLDVKKFFSHSFNSKEILGKIIRTTDKRRLPYHYKNIISKNHLHSDLFCSGCIFKAIAEE